MTRAALVFAGASTALACSSSSSAVVYYGPAPIDDDGGAPDAALDAGSDVNVSRDAGDASPTRDASDASRETDASKHAEAGPFDASSVVFYGPAPISRWHEQDELGELKEVPALHEEEDPPAPPRVP